MCIPSHRAHASHLTLPSHPQVRTYGFSTTNNALGESRFDFFVAAKSGEQHRVAIGIELVNGADVTPTSFKNKAARMRAQDYGDAPLVFLVIYVSHRHPLSHLVLSRQVRSYVSKR